MSHAVDLCTNEALAIAHVLDGLHTSEQHLFSLQLTIMDEDAALISSLIRCAQGGGEAATIAKAKGDDVTDEQLCIYLVETHVHFYLPQRCGNDGRVEKATVFGKSQILCALLY